MPAARRSLVAAAVAATALLAGFSLPAHADTRTVICGPSLQQAIDDAADGDLILVEEPEEGACTGTSYTLPSRPEDFSITIQGTDHPTTTLSGAGADPSTPRLFTGTDVGRVTLSRMELRDSFSGPGNDGGAIHLDGASALTLEGIAFRANSAGGSGGAVYIRSTSSFPIVIADTSFGGVDEAGALNTAGDDGGAVAIADAPGAGPAVELHDAWFMRNEAGGSGGGLAVDESTAGGSAVSMEWTHFLENRATRDGAGARIGSGGDVSLTRTFVESNELETTGGPARGAGIFATAIAPGLHLHQSDSSFDDNRMTRAGGTEFSGGGAGEWVGGFSVVSRSDSFDRNSLPAREGPDPVRGAGVAVDGCGSAAADTTVRFENLVAAGNTIGAGGDAAGVHLTGCGGHDQAATLLNSTIAGNQAAGEGGTGGLAGGAGPDDTLTVRNSIVAANIGGPDLAGWTPASRAVSFSDVCAPGVLPGSGNICADPRLAPNPWNADVHETQFSPTIDHGSNAAVPADLTTDYDVDPREIGPVVDMGADEYSAPTAITSSTRSVGPFAATITGAVNPNRYDASYRFEYGRTKAYGRSTPSGTVGEGAGTVLVSRRIKNLRPDATYHFRVMATNGSGSTVGMDHRFRTDPDPFGGVGLSDQTVRMRNRRVAILVTCPNGTRGGCAGKLTLRRTRHADPFGKARFSLRKGHSRLVKVKLPRPVRDALRQNGRLVVKAIATAHDAYVTRKRRATVTLEP
jgi:hypothetical protein